MENRQKTKDQLAEELAELRQKLAETEDKFRRTKQMMRKAVVQANDEKARTEAVITALGDGVSIQDLHYRVLFQNERHKQFVGEHIGEYCYKAYQKNDSVCEGCHLALSFTDGKIHKKEQQRVTDRGTLYYEIISSPLRNSRGEIIAGIEAVRDITDRKLAELEKEDLIAQLKDASDKINTLKGLLPMCAWCRKIRDDNGYWKQLETFISEYSGAEFTHGICPECKEKVDREEQAEDRPETDMPLQH